MRLIEFENRSLVDKCEDAIKEWVEEYERDHPEATEEQLWNFIEQKIKEFDGEESSI